MHLKLLNNQYIFLINPTTILKLSPLLYNRHKNS
nr:MAG TPA: hypothetical protein [Caudoviricetes sp.]